MKKILIIMNIICAALHLIFEFYHINNYNKDVYSFLLVENAIITFVFILMTYFIFISKKDYRILYIPLIFWIFFEMIIFLLRPNYTTLNIIKQYLPVLSQWIILSIYGGIIIMLTILEIIRQRTLEKSNVY